LATLLRMRSVAVVAALSAILAAWAIPVVRGADVAEKWTVLIYLDGDNNLDPYSVDDIEEMKMIGSTENVNVLVLWDRYAEPAYLYKVVPGDLVLMSGLVVDGREVNGAEVSMADWHVLESFVDYGKANFPADHYMLDLWDHGSPYGYACWDDHVATEWETPDTAISLSGVVSALEGTGTMDILTYDGCTIGMVEIAHEFSLVPAEKVQIEYLVASEEYIPGSGYAYDQILQEMKSMSDLSSAAVATMLADTYAACYSPHGQAKGSSTVGLSVIDLSMIGPIAPALKSLTGMLIQGLHEDFDYYHDLIAEARGEANLGWSLNGWDQRVDMGTFLAALASSSDEQEVRDLAEAILQMIADALYVANTPALESMGAVGLGVWFPVSARSLGNANAGPSSLARYVTAFEFVDDAGWVDFLYAFWGKAPKMA
jgi:hypothetical protein